MKDLDEYLIAEGIALFVDNPDDIETLRPPYDADTLKEILKHKNHYNHSLYSFDEDGGHAKTILMRIAETKQGMKFGKSQDLDDEEIERIRGSIKKIEELNRAAWAIILKNRFPV